MPEQPMVYKIGDESFLTAKLELKGDLCPIELAAFVRYSIECFELSPEVSLSLQLANCD